MVKNKLEFRHIPKKNDIKKRRRHKQRDLVRKTEKKKETHTKRPSETDRQKRRRHIKRDLVRKTDKKEGERYKET